MASALSSGKGAGVRTLHVEAGVVPSNSWCASSLQVAAAFPGDAGFAGAESERGG